MSSNKKTNLSKKRSSSSLSAESTGHNEDLMTQIALYLPVKSILRFRSVSKQWYSVLTHPQFILSHEAKKHSMLFFRSYISRSLDFEYFYLNGNDHNLVIADFSCLQNPSQDDLFLTSSCNGLLLLESTNFKVGEQHGRRRLFVCNPSTRKHSELALPDYIASGKSSISAALAFDPSKSPFYKVLFFWNSHWYFSSYHISIYSSETKACRKITHTSEHTPDLPPVFFNGAICWADSSYHLNVTLYYFDINQESINVFPKPPNCGPNDYIVHFREFRGHLNMILYDRRRPLQGVLDVYVLKEDYSSWGAKYKVDLDAIAVDFPKIIYTDKYTKCYIYSVLCFVENEEAPTIVLSIRNPPKGDQILTYNLVDKTTKKLTSLRCWTNAIQCTESLFGV